MRRTMVFFAVVAVVAVVASISIGTLGDNVARGQTETEIHVATVAGYIKSVGYDDGREGIGAGDRGVAWEPLFAEDLVTRVGKAYYDCVGVGGTTGSYKHSMCDVLWNLEGGQITFRYLETPGEDFRFAVTGGTGIYANAVGDGTITKFKKHADWDWVITLAG